MAKLYWQTMKISDTGGTTGQVTISGVITDGIEVIENEETATIEDNQEVNIAYEGGFSAETRNLTLDGGSDPIIDDSNVNSTSQKSRVILTAEDGTTATIDGVYVRARKGIISTGELGVKLACARTSDSDPITYA
jgi:hypothetical protein